MVLFSDAVIAIAITLLVLDLRVSEVAGADLQHQLLEVVPNILSFLASFAVIGLFWEAHHRLFLYVDGYDRTLLWLNLLFLMLLAFLPFPTAVLGKHWSLLAIVVYAATLTATGLVRVLILRYVVARNFLAAGTDPLLIKIERWRAAAVPAIFALSIGAAFIRTELAPICWILLAPVSVLGRRGITRDSSAA